MKLLMTFNTPFGPITRFLQEYEIVPTVGDMVEFADEQVVAKIISCKITYYNNSQSMIFECE